MEDDIRTQIAESYVMEIRATIEELEKHLEDLQILLAHDSSEVA